MAVQSEIQSLQERLQRCAAACQDEAKDLVPAGIDPSDAQFLKAQQRMDSCVTSCADKVLAPHLVNLPPSPSRVSRPCACCLFLCFDPNILFLPIPF